MPRDPNRAAWEDWGRLDPFWAVLSWPGLRNGRWDADGFFATGVEVVDQLLAHACQLGRPAEHRTALDFGCGIGRLTRALAPHFARTDGVDIASTMVAQARRLDGERGSSGAEFRVGDAGSLARYDAGSIDLVASLLVLQHLPSRDEIARCLREFVRLLAPGGVAAFQLPVRVPLAGPDPFATRAKQRIRSLGISPKFLYRALGWQPEMRMTAVPYDDVVAILRSAGGRVLDAPESTAPGDVVSRLYFVAAD